MHREKSFTIIELLIAIFVLTVGLAAAMYVFPLGARVQKSSQMASAAVQLAQGKIEEIISKSYDEISPGALEEPYGFDPDFNSYRRKTEVNYFDPDNPSLPPGSDLGIKKISVTVFWHSSLGVGEKEAELATLIVKR